MLLILLIAVPAHAQTRMDTINVGKGDAIIIQTEGCTVLIDTGKGYACGRLRHAFEELGIDRLDAVFITHVDSDHIEGLQFLTESGIEVDAWYASPFFFEYKEKKHPLNKLDLNVTWLEAGDIVNIGEAEFSVLAPIVKSETEENDNSLVMMLTTPDGRILLTGDMEYPEEMTLLNSDADLDCDILKVSNHGDGDATSGEFILRAAPEYAVISTNSYEKTDTPDPGVVSSLQRAGAEVFVTQDSDTVTAIMDSGSISVTHTFWEYIPDHSGVTLEIDKENELFIIKNPTGQNIPMAGWYLYSDSGNELFIIGSGILPANGSITVGTKTSPADTYDIYWDEKNVIANKKDDLISLYDENGIFIFSSY